METIPLKEPAIVEPIPQTPSTMTSDGLNVQSITSVEQDLKTRGQRRVNLIWEATQSSIAVFVTLATIYTAVVGKESTTLAAAFTLVVAMYFNRTNHTKTGGVGGTGDTR